MYCISPRCTGGRSAIANHSGQTDIASDLLMTTPSLLTINQSLTLMTVERLCNFASNAQFGYRGSLHCSLQTHACNKRLEALLLLQALRFSNERISALDIRCWSSRKHLACMNAWKNTKHQQVV